MSPASGRKRRWRCEKYNRFRVKAILSHGGDAHDDPYKINKTKALRPYAWLNATPIGAGGTPRE